MVPIRVMSDAANGKIGVGFNAPLDLLERVKHFDGVVSIDDWDRLAKLFNGSQYLTPAIESDYLWLDEDSEEMGIEDAEAKMAEYKAGSAKDKEIHLAWKSVRDDIQRMADHRKGLGLNGLTWEIG